MEDVGRIELGEDIRVMMDDSDVNAACILFEMANGTEVPTVFMPWIDMKERFKDVRALSSFNTIEWSSKQVQKYFHKEEDQRYSNPYRAFSYTAQDGTKSSVAPLKRRPAHAGRPWPSPKARGHPMLRDERPHYFTVLSLVRDAASRLPGRMGTRGDICVLVRDSKFVLENASESQVTTVVSAALDRLKSEVDPCIKFDKFKHLWVYLHGDRKEEDY